MSRIRRGLLATCVSIAVLACCAAGAFVLVVFFGAQRADYGWRPVVAHPSFAAQHPVVVIDEGHYNGSIGAIWGRYWPLARLLRADGYEVVRGHGRITSSSLANVRVLIVANASGAGRLQFLGINIPGPKKGERSDPAFSRSEIDALQHWIGAGGALLLIADHAPFGEAAAPLARALGVTMHGGFVEVPHEQSDPLLFSDGNGRLGAHEIINGYAGRPVHRVMTFTGQSLDGPANAAALLRLPPNATESVPIGGRFEERRAGAAQAVAFAFGKGRVVVLGEAAVLTAQVDHRKPFGMNLENDNAAFALNVVRWLAR